MSVRDYLNKLIESHITDEKEKETIFKNAEDLLDDYLCVSTIKTKKQQMILYSEIVSIEIRDTESIISTKKSNYLTLMRQDYLQQIAERLNLQKCDRSTYVNIKEVKKINSILNVILFNNVSSIKEAKEKGYIAIYIHNKYTPLFRDFLGIENDLSYKQEITKGNKSIFRRSHLDEIY